MNSSLGKLQPDLVEWRVPSTWFVPAEEGWPPALVRSGPTPGRSSHSRRRSDIHKIAALSAACLATGFLACITLWAFDPGPDLWPSGAESFSVASDGLWVTSVALCGASAALTAIWFFVTTAGAYLVIRYRARSVLAADNPLISHAYNLAGLWDCTRMDPGLGHFLG